MNISFRYRRYGSTEWVNVDISGEDEEIAQEVAGQMEDILEIDGLHVQKLEGGNWEDL